MWVPYTLSPGQRSPHPGKGLRPLLQAPQACLLLLSPARLEDSNKLTQPQKTKKEISFRMLRDVLRETWTNSEIAQDGREEGLQPGFQQAFLQGLQQAHREVLQEFRQTLLKIVRVRFPKAVRLAKKQTANIEDSAILRDLIVKLSVVQTAEEAVIHLLEIDEDEVVED